MPSFINNVDNVRTAQTSYLCAVSLRKVLVNSRWRKDSAGIWSSVVRNSIWKLKQDDESLWYNCYSSHDMSKESDNDERGAEAEPATDVESGTGAEPTTDVASIRDYFNLHVNLEELYQQWMGS